MKNSKFKNNYEVTLHKLEALSNGAVSIRVFVTEKSTGKFDHYGWTPDCYCAEPYFGTFSDDYGKFDEEVTKYIIDEILDKQPELAEPKLVEIYNKQIKALQM
jgi:hypothetical protein